MFSLSLRQKFILCVSLILVVWLGTASYIETLVSRRQLVESRELEAVRSAGYRAAVGSNCCLAIVGELSQLDAPAPIASSFLFAPFAASVVG